MDGRYGTLTLRADGTYGYALDGERAATKALAPGATAADLITYRLADLAGAVDIAMIEVTVTGAPGVESVATTSPLYTWPGTRDGSAAADQLLIGPAGANSFYFNVAARSGVDRIDLFEAADILLTSVALPDDAGDVIALGADGHLDFDGNGGSSDGVTLGGIDTAGGLRHLGARDGLHVYAAGGARPVRAIEGSLGADRLVGDTADTARQAFFVDSALGIDLGRDRIERSGSRDILATTTALPDGNLDRIIEFGSDRVLGLPSGDLSMTAASGSAIRRLEFDGSVERGGRGLLRLQPRRRSGRSRRSRLLTAPETKAGGTVRHRPYIRRRLSEKPRCPTRA